MWQGMDPQAAANRIRDKVDLDISSKISADDQHKLRFVEHVCRYLGIKPDVPAMLHVQKVLEREGLMQLPPQYPKMLTNDEGKPIYDDAGNAIVFESEADEAAHAAKLKRGFDEKLRAQQEAEKADEAAHAADKPKKKG